MNSIFSKLRFRQRKFEMDLPYGKPTSPRWIAAVLVVIGSPIACIGFWLYSANSFGLPIHPFACLFVPFWLLRTSNLFPRCWVLCWWLSSAWYAFWLLFSLPSLLIFIPLAIPLHGIPLLPHISLLFVTYLSLIGTRNEAELVRSKLD